MAFENMRFLNFFFRRIFPTHTPKISSSLLVQAGLLHPCRRYPSADYSCAGSLSGKQEGDQAKYPFVPFNLMGELHGG